jgi:AbrB family looped-hinge helix DNA binding protein
VEGMVEKVKVGVRGQVVIPKKLRRKLNIKSGSIMEIEESEKGILLKLHNPVEEMRGLGKGVFGDPVKYQGMIRGEWEDSH